MHTCSPRRVRIILGFRTFDSRGVGLRAWMGPYSQARLEAIEGWRVRSFLLGLFLIWLAVASPMAALDHELLTIHMVQHLLLMTLAPPLIWFGAPMKPLLHGLPQGFGNRVILVSIAAEYSDWAGQWHILQFAGLQPLPRLIGWHIPSLFALGMRSGIWHGD